jgi:uncharacterized protein with HEPN domain
MAKRDRQRIADMLAAAQKAIAFTHEKSRPDLDEDEILTLALVRLLEIVGEAARYVPDEIKSSFPDVSWREIAGTRNRLIHGYFAVDLDVVWSIIESDLPILVQQLERILAAE